MTCKSCNLVNLSLQFLLGFLHNIFNWCFNMFQKAKYSEIELMYLYVTSEAQHVSIQQC